MTEAEELSRWRSFGKKLWPWLRMLPMAGCDRELLEAVVEAGVLLGNGDEAQVSISQLGAVEANLDRDACERVADAVVRDRWIMRLEKSKRLEFEQYLRSGAWLR